MDPFQLYILGVEQLGFEEFQMPTDPTARADPDFDQDSEIFQEWDMTSDTAYDQVSSSATNGLSMLRKSRCTQTNNRHLKAALKHVSV